TAGGGVSSAGRPIPLRPKIRRSADAKIAQPADDREATATYGRVDRQPRRRNSNEAALGSLGAADRPALRRMLARRRHARPQPTTGQRLQRKDRRLLRQPLAPSARRRRLLRLPRRHPSPARLPGSTAGTAARG